MSTRGFRCLWIRLQLKDKRFIKMPFPIQLYILEELLDCCLDLLSIACLFIPQRSTGGSSSQISVHSMKELVLDVMALLRALNDDEPYDLIDICTDEVQLSIRVK